MDQIQHVVVLMLENRSFDCLAGYLYQGDHPDHFVGGGDRVYAGIPEAGRVLSNKVGKRSFEVRPAPWKKPRYMTEPCPDPGEYYRPHVLTQLYGPDWAHKDPGADDPDMSGFALDYHTVLGKDGGTVEDADVQHMMNCFPPESLPVLSGLAKSFAISDRWFASVPSQTLCNRSFFHSGQSHGFVTNATPPDSVLMFKWVENTAPTIFERLTDAGLRWRVYWDEADIFPLTRFVHPQLLSPRYEDNFVGYHCRARSTGRFEQDCQRGDLPEYTFIQPRLLFNHNDMHPPVPFNILVKSSLLAGEVLVDNIYNALVNSECWTKTLFVITFDEHGGCYDHVAPTKAVPPFPLDEPKPPYSLEDDFGFNRLGVRVPAIFVSPYIEPKSVLRAPEEKNAFDHTSMIKSLCTRWGLPGLQARDESDGTATIWDVLSSERRSDKPQFTPRPYHTCLDHFIDRRRPLSDFQRHQVALIHAHLGRDAELPSWRTVGDAVRALETLRK